MVRSVQTLSALPSLRRQRRRQHHGGELAYYTAPVGYMRGSGLGGVISKLFRAFVPIFKRPVVQAGLKKIGKSVARAGLQAASQALSSDPNVNFRETIRESARREASRFVDELKQQQQQQQENPARPRSIKRIPSQKIRPSSPHRVTFKTRRDVFS